MNHARLPRHVMLLLLAVLLGINGAAVYGIVASRRAAEGAAREEAALETAMYARSLEARLASLRADLGFLAQSPPLRALSLALDDPDAIARRWRRLDIDAILLLFLDAHPEIEELVVRDRKGEPVVAAVRRDGAPALAQPQRFASLSSSSAIFANRHAPDWIRGVWTLGPTGGGAVSGREGGTGTLEALVSARPLLADVAPGRSALVFLEVTGGADPARDSGAVVATVTDDSWDPPVRRTLLRRQEESRLVASVSALAARYRATVVLNLVVMSLALVLGAIAFGQARERAALETASREHATIRDLELKLLHSERLAAVGRLAAGMAHEINNPLEGMSNYLALLEDDLRGGRPESAFELVGQVRAGLERVAAIVRQVLTFSSPGRAPKGPLDLGVTLGDAVRFVQSNPAFRAVPIVLLAPEVPLVVEGNAVTLGQLFLNLVLNACQACARNPGSNGVELKTRTQAGRVVVTIRDHGPGIEPEAGERLFEPFFSTRGSTGLGLSVCYGIARDHGGSVAAHNASGGGAEFTVDLPLAAAPTPSTPTPGGTALDEVDGVDDLDDVDDVDPRETEGSELPSDQECSRLSGGAREQGARS